MIRRPPRPTLFPSTPLFRSGAGPPDAQEYAGELGGFVLARSAVDRMSARRGDTDWLAAAWADPRTRVLVLDNARALVRFGEDRKSTRLNSSHSQTSYAVFCL